MEIDPEWSEVLKIASCTKPVSVCGFAKVAGKSQVRIPAGSVSVVRVNGWQGPQNSSTAALVEPLKGQIPGNIIVINTVTQVSNGQLHVRVATITDEDLWLQLHTRIGVLHEVDDVMDTKNTVDFKMVSINEEMVYVSSPGHNHFWILDDVTNMGAVVGPRGNSFITLVRALVPLFRKHVP